MTTHERSEEWVGSDGRLRVPVERWLDPTPKREGWVPWWVNINLRNRIQKVVIYRPVTQDPADHELLGETTAAQILTDGALAERLIRLAENVRAFSTQQRAALLAEAARRLATR